MSMKRKVTSLLILLIFLVLSITGVLSYFTEYTRSIVTVHTVFGMAFTLIALAHIFNNISPLKRYAKNWILLPLFALTGAIAYFATTESIIMKEFMDYGARSKASMGIKETSGKYSEITMSLDKAIKLSLELKKAKHFWHPQVAIWVEDTSGNYLETLYVTKATAKGIFLGGRTKDNYKELDTNTENEDDSYRRVNALPVWSHKRGVIYSDGLYVPTFDDPIPDGITGATPLSNFKVNTSVDYSQPIVIKLEINVAFDDNEYYSEYDFADDEVFHNGTGQLGQPSLIYSAIVDTTDQKSHYVMDIEGHGHHSGQDGEVFTDLSKLTTALQVVEYIVVGLK